MRSEGNWDMESLLPQHGGYQNLKSVPLTQLVFDIPTRFCENILIEKDAHATRWSKQRALAYKTSPKAASPVGHRRKWN